LHVAALSVIAANLAAAFYVCCHARAAVRVN